MLTVVLRTWESSVCDVIPKALPADDEVISDEEAAAGGAFGSERGV